MAAYAYICTKCGHPASRHVQRLPGKHEGPYPCTVDCLCQMMLDTPQEEINRKEYERRFPELVTRYRTPEERKG